MNTATQIKRKAMHDNEFVNLFLILKGAIATAFVVGAEKIFGFVLSVPIVNSYINPEVREFLLEISPIIGILVGLLTLISLLYKIKISRKELKDKNNSDKK